MAISNIPTFADGEILTAAKLNQLGTAVDTKFSGAITGADMAWPLVAQGNIDMNNSYTFTNLRTLWGVVNIDEYDTFADAVSALPSAGGCLFVPPGTTIDLDGETISKSFMIMGCGRTSVLRTTLNASTGFMIRTAAGVSDVEIINCTLDGRSATGTSEDGLQLRQVSKALLHGVWFKNFKKDALFIGNDGTAGNESTDVKVLGCHFEGGDDDQIFIDDVDGLVIAGCTFDNPTDICIEGTPDTVASKMRSIKIYGNEFKNCVQAVDIKGASATANDLWRLIQVYDNDVYTCSGDAITVGHTTAIIKWAKVSDNNIIAAGGDALVVLASGGKVANNYCPDAVGDGLDMTDCQGVSVNNNDFTDAGALGIDSTGRRSYSQRWCYWQPVRQQLWGRKQRGRHWAHSVASYWNHNYRCNCHDCDNDCNPGRFCQGRGHHSHPLKHINLWR